MNIAQFKESLPYLFEAQLTAFVWGNAGIGKSQTVRQYAESKGYHFFPLYLGTQSDLGDVLGLADFVRDKNGTAIATTFATPIWLKNAIDYCENNPKSGAIIFLDEFNRARRDVLQGMFSLALDKTFHTIKLPKNCHVIAAGNPPTEDYNVTDVDETALMSRFVHIKLEPSVEEFIQYAKDTDIEPTLITFIQEQPKLLEDARGTFDLPVKVDRRAYERLNRLFKSKTPYNILEQLMQGIIGIERTVAYQLHLKSCDKPLTADDILAGKGFDKLNVWSNPKDVKASLLSICYDNILERFLEMDKSKNKMDNKEKANFLAFILTLPTDITYAFLVKIMSDGSPVFKDWADNKENQKHLVEIVKKARPEAAKAMENK